MGKVCVTKSFSVSVFLTSNCSQAISYSDTLVKPDEVVILAIVFSLWGGAIALFIRRLEMSI